VDDAVEDSEREEQGPVRSAQGQGHVEAACREDRELAQGLEARGREEPLGQRQQLPGRHDGPEEEGRAQGRQGRTPLTPDPTARRCRVGISGWTYAAWRGDFYPRGLAHRRELEYAASQLSSIEINGSFYSLQRPTSYRRWNDETPDDFVFAVKGGRFITHLKRLRDVEAPLANFFASGVLALGAKLGPVLWQLPESLTFDAEVLDAFLALLPRTTTEAASLAARHDDRLSDDRVDAAVRVEQPVRHAVEVRSSTFVDERFFDILTAHEVGCVLADTAGRWPVLDRRTCDLRYVRLHGDRELYASGYTGTALDGWADRCRRWAEDGEDVFVYFDNDIKGFAPHDARSLLQRLRDTGHA
jgi:uncharacterized protein YecE (DUF72 family)